MPSRPRLADAPWLVLDALVGWLAAWQLVALAAVYVGLSFDVLTALGVLAFGGALLPALTRPWEVPEREDEPVSAVRWWWVVPALLVMPLAQQGLESRAMAVGVMALITLPLAAVHVAPRARVAPSTELRADALDVVSLAVTGVAATLITTALCRPDVDDGYYLNEVLQTLLHPDLAVLSFDGIHGVPGAPLQQVIHRPQTYEALVAFVCRLTGGEPRTVYWLWMPAVVAALSPLAWWSVARQLVPRLAWLAVPLTLGVLCTWGDGPQTIARFGLPRLFQGKSVFVFAMVAVVVHASLRHASEGTWRSALRLAAAGLAASLFTSTALVVAPIAVGLALLAGLRPDRAGLRTFGTGLLTTTPLLITLVLSFLELRAAGGLASDGYQQADTTSLGNMRSALALAWLASVPWWMGDRPQRPLVARYVVVSVLIVASGLGPLLLGEVVADLLNWRTFWAIPFAVLMGVGAACGLEAGWRAIRAWRPMDVARVGWLALLATMFVRAGDWSVEKDGIDVRFAEPKVKPAFEELADAVLALAGPDDVVAAPPDASQALAMRADKPKLVGVWVRYLNNLTRFWGQEETDRRLAVLEYTRGTKPMGLPADVLDTLCVRVLVVAAKRRSENDREGLGAIGFTMVREVAGHVIWVRPRERLPGGCR
ncbi:MAG: hypothetical protein H6738_13200 [Alphaproteobacteria bacterium]|nr:hypothetical protein [Alphaproteobacteria bacterium]